jgi:hypothetical protein
MQRTLAAMGGHLTLIVLSGSGAGGAGYGADCGEG